MVFHLLEKVKGRFLNPPSITLELAGTHPDSKLVGDGGDPCQEMAKGMMTDADWKDDERWNKNRSVETYQILVKTTSKTSTSLRDFLCCGCKH